VFAARDLIERVATPAIEAIQDALVFFWSA
jgi:hypothetical protein